MPKNYLRWKAIWKFCAVLLLVCIRHGPSRRAHALCLADARERSGCPRLLLLGAAAGRPGRNNTHMGGRLITIIPKVMTAGRAELLLAASSEITMTLLATSTEREKTLQAVMILLDKGLTGYRLFLTNTHTQQRLNQACAC